MVFILQLLTFALQANTNGIIHEKRNLLPLLQWKECEFSPVFVCATIDVPLNHSKRNSIKIPIELTKYSARIQPAEKTIFLEHGKKNIVELVEQNIADIFDDKVDFIYVHSRRSRESNLMTFLDDEDWQNLENLNIFGIRTLPRSMNFSQISYFDKIIGVLIKKLNHSTGEELRYMSTADNARDLEFVRKALGLKELNFLGFGNGAVLGLTYANLFPDNVGQVILDAVPNIEKFVSHPLDNVLHGARSAEKVLRKLTDLCDSNTLCPLFSPSIDFLMKDANSYDQIYQFIQKSRKNPILVDSTPIPFIFTSHVLEKYLLTSLVEPELWLEFFDVISMANAGDFVGLEYIAGKHAYQSGTHTIISASTCADKKDATNDSLMKWFEIMEKPSSQFMVGFNFQVSELLGCRHWKRYENQERYSGPWNKKFANPILLIGTAYNPYVSSEDTLETHEILNRGFVDTANSYVLIHNGFGRDSLSDPSMCTKFVMKDFMLKGEVPPAQIHCEPDNDPFHFPWL